jgi:hypothetical protein
MVPSWALPPATWFTVQLTVGLVEPVTVAAYCAVEPSVTVTEPLTVTVTATAGAAEEVVAEAAGFEPLLLAQAVTRRSAPLMDAATTIRRRFRGIACFLYLNAGAAEAQAFQCAVHRPEPVEARERCLSLRVLKLSGRGQRCLGAERTFLVFISGAYFRLISRREEPVFFFPLLNTVPFQNSLYDLSGCLTQTTEYDLGTIPVLEVARTRKRPGGVGPG